MEVMFKPLALRDAGPQSTADELVRKRKKASRSLINFSLNKSHEPHEPIFPEKRNIAIIDPFSLSESHELIAPRKKTP
jgi:hypothetical protein